MLVTSFDTFRAAVERQHLKIANAHGDSFQAQCPAHDDKAPSMSVKYANGKVLVQDFAGCDVRDIVAALDLKMEDLFDEEPDREKNRLPVAEYQYIDPFTSEIAFVKERYYPKNFLIYHYDERGEKTYRINKGAKPWLYHAPELRAALDRGDVIWLVEGEADVHAIEHMGGVATTQPHGAGKGAWKPFHTAMLRRAQEVRIVVDLDDDQPNGTNVGRDYAFAIRDALIAQGNKVTLWKSPAGKDAYDALKAGKTLEDFKRYDLGRVRVDGIHGDALQVKQFPPLIYAVEGILPQGLAILAASPKAGKALALDTPLLTTDGWKSMETVQVGDYVYGKDGEPTKVIAKSDVFVGHDCFEVTTRSGARVVADADHLWEVHQRDLERVVDTRALAAGHGDRRWLLPMAGSVNSPPAELPLDPWILGYWLGNGSRTTSVICTHLEDAEEVMFRFAAAGFPPATGKMKGEFGWQFTATGLVTAIRALGLFDNKHIPHEYLTASAEQRLALLRGLCDADSHTMTTPNGSGSIEFSSTTPSLATGATFLARSLGWKATIASHRATLNGKDCGEYWRVAFVASRSNPPVLLARRTEALPWRDPAQRSFRDAIESVVPVESVPTQCITVERPDGTYLAGPSLMVTHNSFVALDMAVGVAVGGVCMSGLKCTQGDVLYIGLEDSERRLKSRIDLLNEGQWPDLSRIEFQTIDSGWMGGDTGMSWMEEWALEVDDPRLIVIDTLGKAEPALDESQNRYLAEQAMMLKYKRFADRHDCTILFVHHNRKMNDESDWLNALSGSKGITGGADTLLYIDFKRGERDGFLRVEGRDVEADDVPISKPRGRPFWRAQKAPESLEDEVWAPDPDWGPNARQKAILRALAAHKAPMPIADLLAAFDEPINEDLGELARYRKVARDAENRVRVL